MSLTLIHELTADGRHRIVAVANDGTNSASEWVDQRSLAEHLGVLASAGNIQGLPVGIFKTKEVAYQVLA